MRVSRSVAALGIAAVALLGGATGASAATHAPSAVSHATYDRGHDHDYGRGDRDGHWGNRHWGDEHHRGNHGWGNQGWGNRGWGDRDRDRGWGEHGWGNRGWGNRHHWGHDHR
ncbi:hypothetical protein [Streptomyces sp. NPDC003480]